MFQAGQNFTIAFLSNGSWQQKRYLGPDTVLLLHGQKSKSRVCRLPCPPALTFRLEPTDKSRVQMPLQILIDRGIRRVLSRNVGQRPDHSLSRLLRCFEEK